MKEFYTAKSKLLISDSVGSLSLVNRVSLEAYLEYNPPNIERCHGEVMKELLALAELETDDLTLFDCLKSSYVIISKNKNGEIDIALSLNQPTGSRGFRLFSALYTGVEDFLMSDEREENFYIIDAVSFLDYCIDTPEELRQFLETCKS